MTPHPDPPGSEPGRISNPAQRLLTDHRRFELVEDAFYTWEYREGATTHLALPVLAGFHHDFATVPRPIWALISPFDLGLASIFHDWLYQHGGRVTTLTWDGSQWLEVQTPWSRKDADRLFARIMREQGVAKWRRRAAYLAVHWFGGEAWKD